MSPLSYHGAVSGNSPVQDLGTDTARVSECCRHCSGSTRSGRVCPLLSSGQEVRTSHTHRITLSPLQAGFDASPLTLAMCV